MSSDSIDLTDISAFPYAGWLPTANGRLSFRHVGEAKHPSVSIYANVVTDDKRIILGYQERDFGDVLFPSLLKLVGISGRFWFALTATSNDLPTESDALSGTIYIYKSKEDWRKKGEVAIRPNLKEINAASRVETFASYDEKVEHLFKAAETGLKITADIKTNFFLSRNGEVYFSHPTFLEPKLQEASELYASGLNHDFIKWISDQSYFFLRDITHQHRHHEASEDTILILQNRDNDENSWRRKILYSLHYQVIRTKRFSTTYSLAQAMGILAYANSFYKICTRSAQENPSFPKFNTDEMLGSIQAQIYQNQSQQSEKEYNASRRMSLATNIRSLSLSVTAIFISFMIAFMQPSINDGYFNKETIAIRDNILQLSLAAFMILLFIWTATTERVYNWFWSSDIMELANVRRKKSILFIGLFSFLIALGALYLGGPAILNMLEAFEKVL
ncbi:hypothetical protein [Parvibaculum sp. MBR-TMA-1.3b-4.2]